MSSLYYKNLKVDNPERTEERVVNRLWEFFNYFDKTEIRLKKHKPKFAFRIGCSVWKQSPGENKGKSPFKFDRLYFDDRFTRLVPRTNIDGSRKEIRFETEPESPVLYGKQDDKPVAFVFTRAGFLLVDIVPKGVPEDEQDARLRLLENAEMIEITLGGHTRRVEFKSRLKTDDALFVREMPEGSTFALSDNTYVIACQKRAILMLAHSPQPHQLPLLNLFRKHKRDFSWESVPMTEIESWYVLTDPIRDGTDEQQAFVRKALGTPDLAILEGPPGSGKTTTLLELIAQALIRGKRILMVASTHVAVDNILERLVEHRVKEAGNRPLREVCGIVPIRIGDEDNVSDEIKPFCLKNMADTEIRRIQKQLAPLVSSGKADAAQREWASVVAHDKARKEIDTFMIECANLICGTTIGILNAPIIKDSRLSSPLFDIVIIDEASKTTFAEFLVPALHGRRWILSGDVKQLTPYVDRDPIIENLRALPTFPEKNGERQRAICLDVFRAAYQRSPGNKRAPGTSLFLCDTSEEATEYFRYLEDQAEAVNALNRDNGSLHFDVVPCGITKPPRNDPDKLTILGSNTIICVKDIVKEIQPYLPPDILLNNETIKELLGPDMISRMNFCRHNTFDRKEKWEDAVYWRICRAHELKDNQEEYSRLMQEVTLLMPHWEPDDWSRQESRGEFVFDAVNRIRRIALPSIIELLMEGFEVNQSREQDIGLYEGLTYRNEHPEVLEQRHVLLSYQHRMHPAISRFSREMIYSGKALKDAGGMNVRRAWDYGSEFSSPAVWVDCQPSGKDISEPGRSQYNLKEVRELKRDLERFIQWAKDHPKQDNGGIWTVACLSFYKGQARQIMAALESISGKTGIYSSFDRKNVIVRISTVDRFQGHEADLVFLSFVQHRPLVKHRRKNRNAKFAQEPKLGFLNFQNRINVGITRARYQLVIFGHKRNFIDCRIPLLEELASACTAGGITMER